MKEKLVVISIDAMMQSDIAEFAKLPNVGSLLKECAISNGMMCTFPTYTYPCHVSIMSGCWPEKHGVYQNEYLDVTGGKHVWFWYSDVIKCPDCFTYAKKAGLSTAAISWPVTGAHKDIDYCVAEIWTLDRQGDQMRVRKDSDSKNVHEIVIENLIKNSKETDIDLAYDKFATGCCVQIIQKYRPDLTLFHLSLLDKSRHDTGAATELNLDAIRAIDGMIGQVIQAVKDNGDFDNTTFVILGDHGQTDVDTVFKLNTLLARKGYITVEDGRITDWRIFLQSGSFSGEVFTQNIDKAEAYQVLMDIKSEYPQYMERVMTKDVAKVLYHVDGPFDFVVVAQDGVVFSQKATEPLLDKPVKGDYRYSVATHGYVPEKGPNPPFIISGKHAKKGCRLDFGRMIDEAPTFMKILGVDMDDADGRVLDEMIEV